MIEHLQSILTQSNLATAEPIFVVFQKRRIWSDEGEDFVYTRTNRSELEEMSAEEFKALEEEFDQWDNRLRPDKPQYWEEDFNPLEWERTTYVEIDVFCTACFTRLGADDFIKVNGRNLTKPFVYCETLRRNFEMIDIRHGLIEIAKKEQGGSS